MTAILDHLRNVSFKTTASAYETITSDNLVPGDVIEVPRHGCTMQCDAVLVSGNCIVDESMLTGSEIICHYVYIYTYIYMYIYIHIYIQYSIVYMYCIY